MKRTKKMLSVLLALALMLSGLSLYGIEAQAAEFDAFPQMSGGVQTYYIGHYTGNGGAVTIPAETSGVPVTSIRFEAFLNCSNVVSVSIPDSVTEIGFYAFKGCSGLERINIPNGLTTIETGTFEGCSSLKEISIPAGVKSIYGNAFDGCSSLERITVAEDNTEYDSRGNCNAIIRTKSNQLIVGCENTVIPDNVTEIWNRAFNGRSGLTEISIPASVKTINEFAFSDCNSLKKINIPAGVTSIHSSAFTGCSGLESIMVDEGNTVYDSRNNCNAIIRTASNELRLGCINTIIPSEVTSIGDDAFNGCSSLTEIRIPSGVTSIDSGAFEGCSGLTEIRIPSGVKFIGSCAFSGCSGLTEINIPDGVKSIYYKTFSDCSGLTEIRLPAGVTSIGQEAFKGCSSLTKINIPDGVTSIGEGAFSGCSSLTKISIPDSVTSIGKSAFEGCSNLTEINIPDSVTSIGEGAFVDCSSLTGEIRIPAGVTSIGASAFNGCSSLEGITVDEDNQTYDSRENCNAIIETASNTLFLGCKNTVIPDGVESIAERAFYDCSSLTRINIPDGVTSIMDDAFNGCSSLTGINIPDSVTSIGKRVFWNCSGLAEITVDEGNTEYDSRDNCNAIIQNVPAQGSDKIYITLIYGCKNTVIPDSVTEIGIGAFYGCTSLTEISIPSGVETINNNAFNGCTGLTDIHIPDSVYGFGNGAFMACTSLMEIRVPNAKAWAMVIPDDAMGYYKYERYGEKVKIPGVIICGQRNSPIHRFAQRNGFEFRALEANDLSWADVVLEQDDYQYDGQEKTPEVTVKMDGETLTPGTDYTVSYSSNIEVGTAEVTITATATGDYLGDVTKKYTIRKGDVSQAEVALEPESYVYDGTAKTPSVTVTLAGKELNPDTDYTVSYADNTNAGQAKVTVTGTGNYEKTAEKTYTISGIDISGAEVTLEQDSYIYDGTAKTPSVTVTLAGKELAFNTDYTVSYSNNIDEGTAKVTVSGAGNYAGKAEKPYTISKTGISAAEVALEQDSYVYDGTAKTPSVTVTLAGKELVLNTDYTVSYSDNTAAGQAKATVTGTGIYAGDVEKTYTISKADISQAVVVLEQESYVYDLAAKTPSVTVKLNGNTLVSGRDYRVSYSDNIAAGQAKVTVTGTGSCTGTAEKDFTISKANLSNAEVILEQENYVYDGTAKTPSVTVTMNGKTLTLDRDYTVSYNSNTNVGTAEVTVTGIGSCFGSQTEYFSIVASGSVVDPSKTDISPAAVTLDKIIYTYDGKAKTPAVTVMLFGKPLSLNTDYTVSYSNNINIGTATVTVAGIGSYTGTKSVNFTIVKAGGNTGGNPGGNTGGNPGGNTGGNPGGNPGGNTNSSITCKETVYKVAYGAKPFKINATSKSKLTFTSSDAKIAAVDANTGTVTIKGTGIATITVKAGSDTVKVTVKVSPKKASLKTAKPAKGKKLKVKWAKDKNASGYQVQVSTAKNFKKNLKQKNVKKNAYTFKKLKAGKKYYVRVRSYKKSGKETLYGAWSGKKQSRKVKK